jgi:hypothetical protein
MRKISCPSRARERSEQALQAVYEHITFAERQDEADGDDKFGLLYIKVWEVSL